MSSLFCDCHIVFVFFEESTVLNQPGVTGTSDAFVEVWRNDSSVTSHFHLLLDSSHDDNHYDEGVSQTHYKQTKYYYLKISAWTEGVIGHHWNQSAFNNTIVSSSQSFSVDPFLASHDPADIFDHIFKSKPFTCQRVQNPGKSSSSLVFIVQHVQPDQNLHLITIPTCFWCSPESSARSLLLIIQLPLCKLKGTIPWCCRCHPAPHVHLFRFSVRDNSSVSTSLKLRVWLSS